MKQPHEFTIDDVIFWLVAIGLGEKQGAFKSNAIDGAMLVTLTHQDLMNELGLTNLQAQKVGRSIQKRAHDNSQGRLERRQGHPFRSSIRASAIHAHAVCAITAAACGADLLGGRRADAIAIVNDGEHVVIGICRGRC
jgi:hypothetical protein